MATFIPIAKAAEQLGSPNPKAAAEVIRRYNAQNPGRAVARLHGKVNAADLRRMIDEKSAGMRA